MKLCRKDPLLTLIFDRYRAHPLRVPQKRVAPLSVFFKLSSDQIKWIGQLPELVDEATRAELEDMDSYESALADVVAQHSSEIDTSLGLDILGGFLAAFGAASCLPAIHVQFGNVKKLSFAINDACQTGYSLAKLGDVLPTKSSRRGFAQPRLRRAI